MPYIEKKTRSGPVVEVERYFASSIGKGGRREQRAKESEESKKTANKKRSRKQLWRMINCNFNGKAGDMWLTLTAARGIAEAEMQRKFKNFIGRLGRWCKKQGIKLKWIGILEKQGQWHYHMILPKMDWEEVTRIWGEGRVTFGRLDDMESVRALANYLKAEEKEPKAGGAEKEPREKGARSWSHSRNLKQPKEEIKEIARPGIMEKIPKAPRGYIMLDWWAGADGWGNLRQEFVYKKIERTKEHGSKGTDGRAKASDGSGVPRAANPKGVKHGGGGKAMRRK